MSNNGVELFTIDGKVDKVDKRIEQLCMGIMKKKLKKIDIMRYCNDIV